MEAPTDGYQEFGWLSAAAQCSDPYLTPVVLRLIGVPTAGNARVLDVGCGNGHLVGLLAGRGFEAVGIDLSAEGIAVARRSHPEIRFEQLPADERVLETLGEPAFDLVVSTEVIEHLYDPSAYFKGCFAALRHGGQLIVSTPFHNVAKSVLIALSGHFDDHYQPGRVGGHIKFFTRRSLTELAERHGFVEIGFVGAGRIPGLWKSMVITASRPD